MEVKKNIKSELYKQGNKAMQSYTSLHFHFNNITTLSLPTHALIFLLITLLKGKEGM